MPPASDRSKRWTLSRAGIINVYQCGDETLEFGGGRLLLRGVNGSGKSTAMNMLLPFLLDADTRRIDAAGEQSGVLRAWMLSGRDESQPQGYLWLEVAQGASGVAPLVAYPRRSALFPKRADVQRAPGKRQPT